MEEYQGLVEFGGLFMILSPGDTLPVPAPRPLPATSAYWWLGVGLGCTGVSRGVILEMHAWGQLSWASTAC